MKSYLKMGVATFFVALTLTLPSFGQSAALNGLDAYIQKAMGDWHVPGLAVAVVRDDRIVYAKGFGVRRIGHENLVNSATLFPIGSATKAFTAAAVGILVDEGKVKWDAPVLNYLPEIRFPTDDLTAHVTVRDILSHRTGIGDDLQSYWGTTATTRDLLGKLVSLPVHAGLRERFEYNNLMYVAAGELVARVSGIPWPMFIRDRLLQPLGMMSTAPAKAYLRDATNLSSGHTRDGRGGVHEAPLLDFTSIAPAGAMFSNVSDMALWVRFQLGNGTVNGRQLLTATTLNETHSPQVVIPRDSPFAPFFSDNVFSTYDLGWTSNDYHAISSSSTPAPLTPSGRWSL